MADDRDANESVDAGPFNVDLERQPLRSESSNPNLPNTPNLHRRQTRSQTRSAAADAVEELLQRQLGNIQTHHRDNSTGATVIRTQNIASNNLRHNQTNSAQEIQRHRWDHSTKISRQEQQNAINGTTILIIVIVSLFAIAGLYVTLFPTTVENEKLIRHEVNVTQVHEFFNEFRVDFPGQNEHLWKLLKASVKAIVRKNPEPTQPAVVLFMAKEGAEQTTRCLVNSLSKRLEILFSNNENFIHKQGEYLKNADGSDLKQKIEAAAQEGFERGNHVFLLENLNFIPAESAMMFHGLCDNDSAPFIKFIYFMTVNAVDLIATKGMGDDELSKIQIADVWKEDLDVDRRGALESRIGGSKVVIQPEKNLSICGK